MRIRNNFRKIIGMIVLVMVGILFSMNASAAKDFIVENKTSALFIINGTTGNIILTPSFGMVGIGTVNPINALTIIGSISAFGSLNATFINATEIRIGNNLIPTSGAFNNANYTALEDSAFRIVNFTTQLNNYIPSFFNNENFTNLKPFTLTNYSAEYASTGYKLSNFTANYEAQAYFKIANYTALENAAFTNANYSNLNNSLWNLSRNLILYPKDANYLVRVGDVNRNISNDTFAVIGSAAVYGSLNATSFNSSFILQNNNQVQTINAVFNNVNYTALENAAFTNTNYTSLEAAAFNKINYSAEYSSSGFKISNYTALEDAAFRIANFTTNYENQAYFKIANYTALENAAFTNANYSNLNNSLWNLSRNLFVYPKDAAFLIRIGDVNRNISNDTFAVIGSAAVYGSLNATSFNSSFILQNNNQVQTINAVFNNVNYTALENAAFTNTNYTNLEAAAFTKINYSAEYASTGFKNANYTSLEDSAFRIANFTTNYEAQAYFKIANYTALQNAAFTLANYSAEYASTGYKLANFTSNLNAQNSSLWNRSVTNIYLRFIDDLIGIGTITPDSRLTIRGTDADANLAGQPGLLHLNITDSYNKSATNLITLDHNLNNPGNSTGGIGIGILFRAVNNDSELVNVSFINASLVNAINGSEASALSFYTRAANGLLVPKLILNGSDVFIGANAATGGAITVLNSGSVGIGTTTPQNKLEVIGAVTLAGGVNASSLNVTGFSITDDSLVTLSDGSKKKIKDIRAGEEVLTLDEATGKLVPRKVNALLDHGIKPIYEMATEDGRVINTTAEHPYLVKLYDKELCDKYAGNVWNKEAGEFNGYCIRWVEVRDLKEDIEIAVPYKPSLFATSSASRTSIAAKPLSRFSFDQSGHLNFIANATYSVSFVCGANNLFASNNLSLKSSNGTILIFSLSSANKILNSSADNFDLMSSSILCASNSVKSSSGAIGSILSENNKSIVLPLANSPEHSTFASTTTSTYTNSGNLSLYLACRDLDILLPISSASFSDSLLFATIDLKRASSETLSRIASLATSDQFMNLDFSISCFRSSGTDSVIVGISSTSDLFNLFKDVYAQGIFKSLDSDANSDITFEKIASIKTLEPQHVYDLSIEGTRNFIANDIVAHNTYLATSSGNVGINTTVPAQTLTVQGTLNVTPPNGIANSSLYVAASGYVGIGTTTPQNTLDVVGQGGRFNATSGYYPITSVGDTAGQRLMDLRNSSNSRLAIIQGGLGGIGIMSGNVGIGTLNPGKTLEVSGSINGTELNISGATNLAYGSGNVGIGTTVPANKLSVFQGVQGQIAAFTETSAAIDVGHELYITVGGYSEVSGSPLIVGSHFENAVGSRYGYLQLLGGTRAISILSSGNVGIGTTVPGTKLTVAGDANISGSLNVSSGLNVISGNVGIGTTSPGSVLSVTGNFSTTTGALLATSSGNVGVGSTAPTDKLTIGGNFTVQNGGSGYLGTIYNDGNTAGFNGLRVETREVSSSTAVLNTLSNGNSRFYVRGDGNVGIGTTGPEQILDIKKDQDASTALRIINLNAGSAARSDIIFDNDARANLMTLRGYSSGWGTTIPDINDSVLLRGNGVGGLTLSAQHASGVMRFSTGGTAERMRIDTSGNVGIGTTGPAQKLHINGTGAGTGVRLRIDNYASAAADTGIQLEFRGVSSNQLGTITSAWEGSDTTASYMSFGTYGSGALSDKIRITSAGNVGIGTTVPNYLLQVASGTDGRSVNLSNVFFVNGTNSSVSVGSVGITGGKAGKLAFGGVSGSVDGYSIANNAGGNYLKFQADSNPTTNFFVMDNSGNVGIGTTGPSGLLHIAKLANDNPIYIDRYSSNNGHVPTLQFRTSQQNTIGNTATTIGNAYGRLEWYGNDGAGFVRAAYIGVVQASSGATDGTMTLNAGGTSAVTILSSGNVGIGTTTPGTKLDVSGSGDVQLRVNSSGTDAGINLINSNGGRSYVIYSGGSGSGVGSGNLAFYDATAGLTRMVINGSSGNVGIGTTGPNALLDLRSSLPTLRLSDSSTSQNQIDGAIEFVAGDNGNHVNSAIKAITGSTYTNEGGLAFYYSNAGGGLAEAMRYDKNGNVGIGTTGPASTLTVVGNFSATGTKSAVVNTSYGMRKLYAMESPDIRFYDQGISSLNNGMANISLDPIFIETVEPDYQVFLTPEADTAGIYVAEKAKEYFIVKGRNKNSNIPFSWLLSALRKGYSETRLDSERKENTEIIAVIDEENKVTDVNIINNLNNGQSLNASGDKQKESTNAITGNAINEITKSNNEKSAIENKFAVASSKEDEIINKISEKTNLDKEAVKKAITFKRKESKKEKFEEENPTPELPHDLKNLSQIAQKISIINGSIVLRLG